MSPLGRRARSARLVLGLVVGLAGLTGVPASAEPVTASPAADELTNLDAPEIVGDVRVGLPAVVETGAWSHAGLRFTYQWYLDGTPVAGATSRTFVPAAGTHDRLLSATVTATLDGQASLRVWTRDSWVIGKPYLVWSGGPRMVGTRRVGSTLRGVPGLVTTSPVPPKLQWSIDGEPVPGATGTSFVLLPKHARKRVSFSVTADFAGYEPERRATFSRDDKVASGIIQVFRAPSVRGTARVGRTLKVRPGAYAPSGVKVTYRWFAGGRLVKGATRSSFRVTKAMQGKRITVRATVQADGFSARTVSSAPTAKVRKR